MSSAESSALTPRPDVRDRAHVVLCNPVDVRNVGTAIRAVANHGLAAILVVTEAEFDPGDLHAYSAGAVDRVDVRFHTDLDEALDGFGRVIGTSRRGRDPLAPPEWPAAGLPARIDIDAPVAILFGTERTGLTKREIDRCEAVVYVPTCEAHASLNLGHAVALIGYELARPVAEAVGPPPEVAEPLRASVQAREAFYAHIEGVAEELGYPPGRNAEVFTRKLRRVLDRGNLDPDEMSLLAGVFSELRRLHRDLAKK